MNEPPCFVHLVYSPNPDHDGRNIPLLVIRKNERIEVIIRPGWGADLAFATRQYLEDLLVDWRSATPDEIPALLQALSELSTGPLLPVQSGSGDSPAVHALIERILSR